MTFPPEVWDGVMRRLQTALAPISFEMWVPQIVARIDGDCLELGCPTQFHSDRIRDYFLPAIGDCVNAEFGRRVPLRVKVVEPVVEPLVEPLEASEPIATAAASSNSISSSISNNTSSSISNNAETPPNRDGRSKAFARAARSHRGANRRSRETLSIGKAVEATLSAASISMAAPSAPDPSASGTPPRSLKVVGTETTGRPAGPTRVGRPRDPLRSDSRTTSEVRQPAFPLTFDSFTVGSCNALAREAALALANRQQMGLNQLFIVSESGLGKTHLSRAVIGTAARAIGDRARYTTAEAFTSEFTQAVRSSQMPNFKRRYRTQCELLVVEDVQFLAGKAATQLEFFHVVQHVLDCGGRVLLTGDKFPQEMGQFDERVRARLSSGFLAQVDAPDALVRRNILRAKAAHGGIRLPDDCLDLLVETIEGNVRELEGALIQLVTMSSLFKRPIDLELTRESLQGRSPRTKSIALSTTPADIIEAVAGFFRTSPAALASRSRRRDVLVPRQLAMYLCRRYTEASLADIGRALNRDHPSVANAIRKIERQLLENVRLRYQAEALIARLAELGHRPVHNFD